MSNRATHYSWESVEHEALSPLISRRLITGDQLMIAHVYLKQGAIVPEHSHHNEQLTYILEGKLRFTIAGETLDVAAGEVLTIPAHVPHMAEALEDTLDVDVFTPPREDWLAKTDAYLRTPSES
jgi:quercetin dioxygenase-like cupin family protein